MDEEKFTAFMKQAKKPPGTIRGYVNSVKFYQDYLHSHGGIASPDRASPKDMEAFVAWGIEQGEKVYRHLWGIRTYYEFTQDDTMKNTSSRWMEYIQNETRKLREFPKVDPDAVKKLSSAGIRTVNQLLRAGASRQQREALAAQTGASPEALEELFKLSELSRLPGLKKVRGRLFFEAGFDSLEILAAADPEEVCLKIQAYIDESRYEGIAPTVGEAEVAVVMAKFLPKTIT